MRIRNLEIKYWQEKAENISLKSNRPEFQAKSLVYISLLSLGSEFHQFKENTYFLRSQNPFSIKRCFYLLYTILHYSLHLHFEKVLIKETRTWVGYLKIQVTYPPEQIIGILLICLKKITFDVPSQFRPKPSKNQKVFNHRRYYLVHFYNKPIKV